MCLRNATGDIYQCWLIISEVLQHSPDDNFTRNAQDIYHWYQFQITNSKFHLNLPHVNDLKPVQLLSKYIPCTPHSFPIRVLYWVYFVSWKIGVCETTLAHQLLLILVTQCLMLRQNLLYKMYWTAKMLLLADVDEYRWIYSLHLSSSCLMKYYIIQYMISYCAIMWLDCNSTVLDTFMPLLMMMLMMEMIFKSLAICGKSPANGGFLPQRAAKTRALMFSFLLVWPISWTNSGFGSDFRCHNAHVTSLQYGITSPL